MKSLVSCLVVLATTSTTSTIIRQAIVFADAFVIIPPSSSRIVSSFPTTRRNLLTSSSSSSSSTPSIISKRKTRRKHSSLLQAVFYENDDDEYDEEDEEDYQDDDEDDDEDDMIDPDTLGNWREVRRNLAATSSSISTVKRLNDILNRSNGDISSFHTTTTTTSTTTATSSEEEEDEEEESLQISSNYENEEILRSQSKQLAEEYIQGVWAHPIATPEVGGLLIRLPLEVELHRNYKHSLIGSKLRKLMNPTSTTTTTTTTTTRVSDDNVKAWYKLAQQLIEDEMQEIARQADDEGQIDATLLSEESTEMLQLYLDNQETWQEVCLVLEEDEDETTNETNKQRFSIVLNRPMAYKLTDNISKLVLFGMYMNDDDNSINTYYNNNNEKTKSQTSNNGGGIFSSMLMDTMKKKIGSIIDTNKNIYDDDDDDDEEEEDDDDVEEEARLAGKQLNHVLLMNKFLAAFKEECAVYIGGPDNQDEAAIMIHGIQDLPGSREISKGTGIYCSSGKNLHIGIEAAADGVLKGIYNPLDFRFFVGKHSYDMDNDNSNDLIEYDNNYDDYDDEDHYDTTIGMEVETLMGKYQSIACARSIVLKQCISLPKPLWHEVMEICGGELAEISSIERVKSDGLKFHVVDDDADDDDDFDDILDELDQLGKFDDDDDEYYFK